ncbi:hypothetical protein GCM10023169_36110 [Georgenia halophila]|uniref:Uncharacterized protein n=1 Tax=Georgenia halophila TaxID=620889 RepID=A0ABP8LLE2_9MICO
MLYVDRTIKDLGGCVRADVHAETVLIFDLVQVPGRRGHPGPEAARRSSAPACRTTGPAGSPGGWRPGGVCGHADVGGLRAATGLRAEMTVEPFRVSDAITLGVPPPPSAGPGPAGGVTRRRRLRTRVVEARLSGANRHRP